MPEVRLRYDVRGWITQTANVPQSVIDEYKRMCEEDIGDGRAIDQLLEPYTKLEDVLDQLDDPEDIELEEITEAAPSAE